MVYIFFCGGEAAENGQIFNLAADCVRIQCWKVKLDSFTMEAVNNF